MSISGLIQFILGFLIGLLILSGMSAATAYLVMKNLTKQPPEPEYKQSQNPGETSEPQPEPASDKQQGEQSEQKSSSESSQQKSNRNTIEERFGEQAYKARVTWDTGLTLRAEPSINSSRVGGVQYNDRVIILGNSSDGDWQKVYVSQTEQKAWVRAGNVERIN